MDEFFEIQNSLHAEKGKILLSSPVLEDIYFKQAVILICENNSDGSIGFVINHPVKIEIQDLFPDFPEFKANISLGGPVSTDSLQFIHLAGDQIPGSIEILPGLYWGGDFDILKKMIETKMLSPNDLLFFLGYSGWSPDQLNSEIKESSWLITELDVPSIIRPKRSLWKDILSTKGDKYKAWANFPAYPELN